MRDDDKETDTMDKWDEEKLKEVVEKKHGASGNKPGTDIVSSSKEPFFYLKDELFYIYKLSV